MKLQTPSVLLLRQALQKAAKGIESKPSVALLADVLLRQSKKDGKFFFVTGSDDTQLTIPRLSTSWRAASLSPSYCLSSASQTC